MFVLPRKTAQQPQGVPIINWANPITQGLVGLVWMGAGKYKDIVTGIDASQTNVTQDNRASGKTAVVSSAGTNGVYYARITSGYPTSNPAWQLSGSLTCLAYGNHVTPASTNVIFGTSGGGGDGYTIGDQFGARTRSLGVFAGGSLVSISSGTWSNKDAVKGITWNGATLTGYDDGIDFATASGSGNITYGATFTRTRYLGSADHSAPAGNGYWMGLWNRPLSKNEVRSLNEKPFQMFLFNTEKINVNSIAIGQVFTKNIFATQNVNRSSTY